jgi:excisionase family DNA binding protein
MRTYSTIQVAELLGITSDTLHRWIRERKIEAPSIQSLGGMRVRIWSEERVNIVKQYKAEHYRKKPNRKKRKKSKKA